MIEKIEAGKKFSKEQGFTFEVVTEKDLRILTLDEIERLFLSGRLVIFPRINAGFRFKKLERALKSMLYVDMLPSELENIVQREQETLDSITQGRDAWDRHSDQTRRSAFKCHSIMMMAAQSRRDYLERNPDVIEQIKKERTTGAPAQNRIPQMTSSEWEVIDNQCVANAAAVKLVTNV